MKRIHFTLLLSPLLFASCVKEKLYERPNPVDSLPAAVLVRIDWQHVENAMVIDTFEIKAGTEHTSVVSSEQPDTLWVDPGTLDIYVHNTPSGIVFNQETASMNTDGEGYIDASQTGIFFSETKTITAASGKVAEVNIQPVPCTRELRIHLIIPSEQLYDTLNSIVSVKGKLENVARSFNMKTRQEENAGTLVFESLDSLNINIFGLTEGSHILTLEVKTLFDPQKKAEVDLTSELTNFNADKTQPKLISINFSDLSFEFFKQGSRKIIHKK